MKCLLRVLPILCFLAFPWSPSSADPPWKNSEVFKAGDVWQDNALIDVSAGLIQAAVKRDIDRTEPVRDVILGNPVTGTARTRGKVSAVLVPDAHHGVVDLYIRGMTVSDTVAVPPERGLLIYSTTYIPFVLRKRVYVDVTGVHSFPTQVSATARAKLRKVTTTDGRTNTLATNIAESVFESTKETSESIAVDKARTQMIQQFDAEFGPQLAKGNQTFAEKVREIQAKGVPLRRLDFRTTGSLLSLGGWITATGQLPPLPPAPPLHTPFDLAARIHQSVLMQTAWAILGGKTFTVDELGQVAGNVQLAPDIHPALGVVPRELGVQRISVTFADREPLAVAFADQSLALTVRIKELRAGALRLPGLTLTTNYRLENGPGGVEAVRQGPVRIHPFQSAAGFGMQKCFNKVFKERLRIPDLQPPAEMSQIGPLSLTHASIQQGWLTLEWIRKR